MNLLHGCRVGFALCGSFCTFSPVIDAIEQLVGHGCDVTPLMSEVSYQTDTRFGTAAAFNHRIESICGKSIIHTLPETEPIGPRALFDVLVVAPCTGNTLAKLAAGIADTPPSFAVKAHLRNARPVVIALSTNDALSAAAQNIGALLCRKHHYFVPFRQDAPRAKPFSCVAEFSAIPETIGAALKGRQLQPLLLAPTEL